MATNHSKFSSSSSSDSAIVDKLDEIANDIKDIGKRMEGLDNKLESLDDRTNILETTKKWRETSSDGNPRRYSSTGKRSPSGHSMIDTEDRFEQEHPYRR